jgi:hypothetical protein
MTVIESGPWQGALAVDAARRPPAGTANSADEERYAYDPLGRLRQIGGGNAGTARFLHSPGRQARRRSPGADRGHGAAGPGPDLPRRATQRRPSGLIRPLSIASTSRPNTASTAFAGEAATR